MKFIKEQRARARTLYPAMQIGKSGISEGLVDELKKQIKAKRLVKVKFLKSFISDKNKKDAAIDLARKTDSVVAMQIGNVVVLAKKKKINKKPKK